MKTSGLAIACVVLCVIAGMALADGMIVPVRPDLPVRGEWAVKYHHVDIVVRDQVASVTIDQEFVNTGSGTLEVEYVFPVPPGAAIDSMTLSVNGQDFAAKLLKADEARRIYEDIVRRKKDPALLEYVGFGLYKTSAFPLERGKPAKVIVHYTNVCRKDGGAVEVWYPLNTEKFSAKEIEDVKVRVDIKTAADITAVYSPTHDLSVERKNARQAIATYHATDALPANDFQVFYKAADEDVGATLLTHGGEETATGYFLALISPNPRSAAAHAVPKDVVIVLDRSGSMGGEKIDQARQAVEFILNNLNDEDRFNVVPYSDSVETFFESLVPADKTHLEQARDRLDRISAGGGTNIHEALQTALERHWPRGKDAPQDHPLATRPKYVIFLTDGLPTVGERDEARILKNTKEHNAWGARIFAFGVGYDVNVRLLDKLVGENGGRSDYVKPKEPIEAKVSALYAKIRNPVMTGLKMEIANIHISEVYPRELGDLFEGDQIVVAGRFDLPDSSQFNPANYPASIATQLIIKGVYQGQEKTFEYPVTLNFTRRNGDRYAFVEQLWATRRIGWLLDQIQLNGENKEVVDELVSLSMKYGIITPYTSFLADETTRLDRAKELSIMAADSARPLAESVSGASGQVHAMNRQVFNYAVSAPAPAARGGVRMLGAADVDSYESGRSETLSNVRQAGNQGIYRRGGNVWVASNAAKVDLEKATDVQTIDRFSDEYFRLAAANTVAENQILATQQAGEELVVELRGQVYRIR